MPPEDTEQLEIEYPDEDDCGCADIDWRMLDSDHYEVEDDERYVRWYDEPADIDWDYGDDSEDEEFLSER